MLPEIDLFKGNVKEVMPGPATSWRFDRRYDFHGRSLDVHGFPTRNTRVFYVVHIDFLKDSKDIPNIPKP